MLTKIPKLPVNNSPDVQRAFLVSVFAVYPSPERRKFPALGLQEA